MKYFLILQSKWSPTVFFIFHGNTLADGQWTFPPRGIAAKEAWEIGQILGGN